MSCHSELVSESHQFYETLKQVQRDEMVNIL